MRASKPLPEKVTAEDCTCSNCRFWAPNDEDEAIAECHRHSPKAVRLDVDLLSFDGVWPLTYSNDWCGEFEANFSERKL
jgi:hypothetical protein